MTAPRRPLLHVSAVLASLWRGAVWSVTVRDKKGFAVGKNDNLNSTFAKTNPDGDVVINLGGNSSEDTTLEIEQG